MAFEGFNSYSKNYDYYAFFESKLISIMDSCCIKGLCDFNKLLFLEVIICETLLSGQNFENKISTIRLSLIVTTVFHVYHLSIRTASVVQ